MLNIEPFCGIRPTADKAHLVTSRSYITYSRAELRDKMRANPYSFTHIINPAGENTALLPAHKRYNLVADAFAEFLRRGWLQKDEQPAYYVYEQSNDTHTTTGLICAVHLQAYFAGNIKVHENTLRAREAMFAEYLDRVNINAEPVLLTYRKQSALGNLLVEVSNERPDFDFTTTDRLRHRLWVVTDSSRVQAFRLSATQIPDLYIADGHHRTASSAALCARLGCCGSNANLQAAAGYLLAYLVSDDQLHIEPFHRLVNAPVPADFQTQLTSYFHVQPLDAGHLPNNRYAICCYTQATGWLQLTPRPEVLSRRYLSDSELLSNFILKPVWAIVDEKNDKRIDFRGGRFEPAQLQREVLTGKFQALFLLHPCSVTDFMDAADQGESMPPKSTYVEPKLRSALVMLGLDGNLHPPKA